MTRQGAARHEPGDETMTTYRNTKFTTRDYECTNIVACVSAAAPAAFWEAADESILSGLTKLYTQAGVTYYGYL